ncbi:hypothetical protein J4E85_004584 [Alternaria conjuncta]|uniref:uncharacterized protein n=1 Tax=Alternaria conjuncta TaxID=181017 RepID=UPI00221FEA28|nr:uncharacterized protein J4E85_004584 [Alternaria conjuncta]KAI4929963.1 hypothetical protein J4E85_004584 [Alternaria conjuncta]
MGSSASKSIESSSSSSVPRYSSKICQLYLISASPGSNTAHWRLFLDDGTNQLTGTTWEVNYINERPNRGALLLDQTFPRSASHQNAFECNRKSFVKIGDLMDKGSDATIIHGAQSSFRKIEEAKERVLREFTYKVATANCQSFVIDVLSMLRQWDPDLVNKKAIETVQRLCFPTTEKNPAPGCEAWSGATTKFYLELWSFFWYRYRCAEETSRRARKSCTAECDVRDGAVFEMGGQAATGFSGSGVGG